MPRTEPVRILLAIATASLAVLSLAFADFGPMWRGLPAGLAWRAIGVHGLAVIALLACAGLCVSRTPRLSAAVIAIYYAIWALVAAPMILPQPLSMGAWYGFCEAMTCLAGASILCALLQWPRDGSPTPPKVARGVRGAQVLFGLTCVFYGASHFTYASFTAAMVPGWLPGRLLLAYLTGLAHMAAGVAIVIGVAIRLAAILEATMMSLFGLLVWAPSVWAYPRPSWATPPENLWSEIVVTAAVAAAAWIVAVSSKRRRKA